MDLFSFFTFLIPVCSFSFLFDGNYESEKLFDLRVGGMTESEENSGPIGFQNNPAP
jgi:hypothetical protein